MYCQVPTLQIAETQTIPSLCEPEKFSYCFPVVLSLALHRSCYASTDQTQQNIQEDNPLWPLSPTVPFSLVLCTTVLTTLAFPNADLCFLVPSKLGSVLIPPPLTVACEQSSLYYKLVQQKGGLPHLFPLSQGPQSGATCHPMSKSHWSHV